MFSQIFTGGPRDDSTVRFASLQLLHLHHIGTTVQGERNDSQEITGDDVQEVGKLRYSPHRDGGLCSSISFLDFLDISFKLYGSHSTLITINFGTSTYDYGIGFGFGMALITVCLLLFSIQPWFSVIVNYH